MEFWSVFLKSTGTLIRELRVSPFCIGFQVLQAKAENRLVEIFGCGTAAIVCPVGNIKYNGVDVPIPVDEEDNALSKRYV